MADRVRASGADAEVVLGDITVAADADAVAVTAQGWGVDVLVNNAGPFVEHTWDDAEPDAWSASYEGNVVSAVRMVRALVPPMRDQGWGRVINVGSRAATTPLPNMVDYSAAKAAVVNMTSTLARHLADSGVTANTVSPGVIMTEGLREMFAARLAGGGGTQDVDAAVERLEREYAPNPTGRLGRPEDVADVVAFWPAPGPTT